MKHTKVNKRCFNMYAVSVKKTQLQKTLAILAAVAVLAGMVVFAGTKIFSGDKAAAIKGDSAAQREEYLSALGLEFAPSSSVAEVAVPAEFDERFAQYNEMLATMGFDLTPLKGETVKKCTYIITNRPDLGANINAVLLVHNGAIVGGHLLCVDDGTMYALDIPQTDASQTILPQTALSDGVEEEENAAQQTLESAYPSD